MNKKELLYQWRGLGTVSDANILKAFEKVKREDFILKEYRNKAYADIPQPILAGQTISQPTTVIIMLEALEVKQGMEVLEIGSGSGYNAALLSYLAGANGKVYTIEIIHELAEFAKQNLKKFKNVTVYERDGSVGLPEFAPFDRVICTAATSKIPEPLVEQLKEGGIIVIPLGPSYAIKGQIW